MESLLFPLIIFAIAMCITPGPNNIMLTASGANFGFKRTLPHILGVLGGLSVVMAITASGLGLVYSRYPHLQTVLKVAGSLYLLFLAWKIATISKTKDAKTIGSPISFMQAALFQFLNPKALVMSFSAMTTFTVTGSDYLRSALQVIIVFGVICFPSISFWAGFGVAISRLLNTPMRFRTFNVSLGTLTALSIVFIVM